MTLEQLAAEAHDCVRCPLSEGRTNVVFGVGDPTADLMFVGEGPGEQEDLQGEPFVGRSGKLLDRLVYEEMGLTRDSFYIANVVKCLRYNAPVLLGDGETWERIGRLVRVGYDGPVMSIDGDGNIVPRRVIGRYSSPLAGRRVFRLTYRSAKRAGTGRMSIQLTGDHEVLTEEGYVAVDRLRPGARIATGQGLSPLAHDVVCGTVLGDGHIAAASSHLSFSHSVEQDEYAVFKAQLLTELLPTLDRYRVAAVSGGDPSYDVVHVRTLAYSSLRILRSDFYRSVKRVPEWIATKLNARMLAFWFMDDGHTRIRSGRQPIAEIATCGFAPRDLEVLIGGLARLGLIASQRRGRLYFDVGNTRSLSMAIAPYVPPPMRYKLHPEVASSVPFESRRFVLQEPEVLFDDAVAEDITDLKRTDTTFFCIDVEETHNFVTAGGVVHNCRPPGNRDPLPDEIASCRPFLERQLELIDPKVLVTLGNFSTKLLLETSEGISKVRGRVYPYRNGTLVPTYHPAAVLRGGGAAEAEMRADLIRAKRALNR